MSFVGRQIKVVKGRKVPIGTIGNCFWSDFGQYGLKVGLITKEGVKHFTAASNVVIYEPEEESKAVADELDWEIRAEAQASLF